MKYMLSIYWVLGANFSYQPPTFPTELYEALFTIFVTITGIFMASYVLGLVAGVFVADDAEEEEKREKLEGMLGFLKRKNIPEYFKRLVVEYYEQVRG